MFSQQTTVVKTKLDDGIKNPSESKRPQIIANKELKFQGESKKQDMTIEWMKNPNAYLLTNGNVLLADLKECELKIISPATGEELKKFKLDEKYAGLFQLPSGIIVLYRYRESYNSYYGKYMYHEDKVTLFDPVQGEVLEDIVLQGHSESYSCSNNGVVMRQFEYKLGDHRCRHQTAFLNSNWNIVSALDNRSPEFVFILKSGLIITIGDKKCKSRNGTCLQMYSNDWKTFFADDSEEIRKINLKPTLFWANSVHLPPEATGEVREDDFRIVSVSLFPRSDSSVKVPAAGAPSHFFYYPGTVHCAVLLENETIAISGEASQPLQVYTPDKKLLWESKEETEITHMSALPGNLLAIAYNDATIRIYDGEVGSLVYILSGYNIASDAALKYVSQEYIAKKQAEALHANSVTSDSITPTMR